MTFRDDQATAACAECTFILLDPTRADTPGTGRHGGGEPGSLMQLDCRQQEHVWSAMHPAAACTRTLQEGPILLRMFARTADR